MLARIGIAALISLGLLSVGASAQADQEPPVVVELFTSQGCSSCPPADAFLSLLAEREDVIALGFHVDYWDYIGWRDVFGSPAFSARQKGYARTAGRRSIYTPQMIVQGDSDVVGTHPMDVTDLISSYREVPQDVLLQLQRAGDGMIRISAKAVRNPGGPLVIQLIRYDPEAHVDITRGENAGQKLTYSNVVTDWRVLGEWDASAPFQAEVPAKGEKPVVVLIQHKGPGPIEAAARLR
ncbi:DUF1223 domain-containing protein [Pseudooceanicola onchidii]|uniref:DUF1223 domain-containing protein n=1 Tax=Pseudooceanicola onchidii TaxID=2562279 RepID=UPI0010AA58F3|nr:DUF1223 domain-containing protein [Pseudooceanicola onchidii]